jgi:hemerythrin-like domain-containing protein
MGLGHAKCQTRSPMTLEMVGKPKLYDEHCAISALCGRLTDRVKSGEWNLASDIWDDLADRLQEHMRIEEKELFPQYATRGTKEAALVAELMADHVNFGATIDQIDESLERYEDLRARVTELFEQLRRHAQRESETFYPWADRYLRLHESAAPPDP